MWKLKVKGRYIQRTDGYIGGIRLGDEVEAGQSSAREYLGDVHILLKHPPSQEKLSQKETIATRTLFPEAMKASNNCIRFSKALKTVFQTANHREAIVPSFLVPALAQQPQRLSRFSTSTRCSSKIGRAPLSLPPEVTFRIIEPSTRNESSTISRTQPGSTVEIEGPLGSTQLSIPPFVSIETDEENRTRTLSILDTNDKKQKAMWGKQTDTNSDRETRADRTLRYRKSLPS